MARILVCGGRQYSDKEFLFATLDNYLPVCDLIITGAQRARRPKERNFVGADWLAIEWAIARQIPFVGMPAKWNIEPKLAGFTRNQQMIDWWKPEIGVAFPGSNGTLDMVDRLRVSGVEPVFAGW